MANYSLGRRIVIAGEAGAGKTTLAARLSVLLDLPVIELDALRHERGWRSVDWPEVRGRLEALYERYDRGWICDGIYRPVSEFILQHADTVIWLHPPWYTTIQQLFLRTVRRSWTRKQLYGPAGPHESLRMSFLSTRSILLTWAQDHRRLARSHREAFAALEETVAKYELRSPRDVEALLSDAARTAAATG